jgi:uncharacterized protein YbaR (Trm112 family)
MLNPDLLAILVCPACRTKVVQEGERLACQGCGRRYPIRRGIPVMLVEEGDRSLAEANGPLPGGDQTQS